MKQVFNVPKTGQSLNHRDKKRTTLCNGCAARPITDGYKSEAMKTAHHEPLSENLANLLADSHSSKRQTLNGVLRRTEGRGLYLVMILLCLPFISPIPVPGLSNAFGIVIAVLAVRLALKLPPRLPPFLGEREFSPKGMQKITATTTKFLRALEKLARPRYSHLFLLPSIKWTNAIVFFLLGILLALPIPPVVPFTNSLPSWGIILLALAVMEKDGLMIWAAYAVTIAAFIYLGLITGVCVASAEQIVTYLQNFHRN